MRKTLEQKRADRKARQALYAESAARIEKARVEMRAHVSRGTCPDCGGQIKRNLSLAGWYQCEQLGAVGFRKDPTKPSCNFQGFTE